MKEYELKTRLHAQGLASSTMDDLAHDARLAHELLERVQFLEVINAEWTELADRANANKPSHDVVWVVERNYGSGTSSDWRYMKYPGYLDDAWTSDWNDALKCYDRPSADALCVDMPDDYDVRITDHQIVFPSFLEWLRSKSPASTRALRSSC